MVYGAQLPCCSAAQPALRCAALPGGWLLHRAAITMRTCVEQRLACLVCGFAGWDRECERDADWLKAMNVQNPQQVGLPCTLVWVDWCAMLICRMISSCPGCRTAPRQRRGGCPP